MNTVETSQMPLSPIPKWRLLLGYAAFFLLLALIVANLAVITVSAWHVTSETRGIVLLALLWMLGLVATVLICKLLWKGGAGTIPSAPAVLAGRASPFQRGFSAVVAIGGMAGWLLEMQRTLHSGLNLNLDDAFLIFLLALMPIGAVLFAWIAIRGQLPAWFNRQAGDANSTAQ
jgi:hypothetical protein